MIRAVFYLGASNPPPTTTQEPAVSEPPDFVGFLIGGHAGCGKSGRDILCAGVSSAVMLTINTLRENLALKTKFKATNRLIGLKLLNTDYNGSRVIEALLEHLVALDGGSNKIITVIKRTL